MAQNDLFQLRQVFNDAVKAIPMPVREMERRLGVGSGNLYRLLDGSLDLRIRHLLALAEILEVPPTDFLAMGCPEAMRKATRRLSDRIGASAPGDIAPPRLPSGEIQELIRETVREVLDQQGQKPARDRRTRS